MSRCWAAVLFFPGVFLLAAAAAGAAGAARAPLERLDFGEAVRLAERNALTREEFAFAGRYHAEARGEAWRRLYVPSLSVRRDGSDRTTTLSGTERDATLGAQLNFPVYAGGRDRAGHLATLAAQQAAQLGQQSARGDLRLATAEAYFLLAGAGQRLASLRLSVQRAAAEAANARRRREIGLDPGLAALQAELALRDEQLKQVEEQNRLAELALALSHLIRAEVQPTTTLEVGARGQGVLRPLGAYQDWAVQHHPALLQFAQEAAGAAQEVAQRRAVRFPELLLSAGYEEDPDGGSLQRNLALTLVYRFGGHRAELTSGRTTGSLEQRFFQSDGAGGYTSVTAPDEIEATTSGVSLTLFDYRDSAATAESALLQARLRHAQAVRRTVESREERVREIQRRYGELLLARQRLEVAGLRVEKSAAEEAAFRKGLAAGTVRFDELLERRTALSRSRLEQIDARGAVGLAWIFLLGAAGMPLDAP